MKEVKLVVGERLAISNLLNEFKGSLSDLNMIFKVMDKIGFQEKEQKALKMRQITDKSGVSQLSWDITKDKGATFELTEDQAKLIKEQLNSKSEKGEFSPSDRFLFSVAEKFEVITEDDGTSKEKKEK